MKPVREGASGPGDAVSATDAASNAASVFAALTGIHVTEVRLRKRAAGVIEILVAWGDAGPVSSASVA